MSRAMYIGVSDLARKVKKAYIGVGDIATKIKKMYIGDANGVARLCWARDSYKTMIVRYDSSDSNYYLDISTQKEPTTFRSTLSPVPSSAYALFYDKCHRRFLLCTGWAFYIMKDDEDVWTLLTTTSSSISSYLSQGCIDDEDGGIIVYYSNSFRKVFVSSSGVTIANLGGSAPSSLTNNPRGIHVGDYYVACYTYWHDDPDRYAPAYLMYRRVDSLSDAWTHYVIPTQRASYDYNSAVAIGVDNLPLVHYYDGYYYVSVLTGSQTSTADAAIHLFRGRDLSSLSRVYYSHGNGGFSSYGSATAFFKNKLIYRSVNKILNSPAWTSVGTWYLPLSSSPSFYKASSVYGYPRKIVVDDNGMYFTEQSINGASGYWFTYTTDGITYTSVSRPSYNDRFVAHKVNES